MKELKRGGAGTLQAQFIEIMKSQGKPSDLWTVEDMIKASGYDKRQVDNGMGNAWRAGKIDRHRDNLKTEFGWGTARYALKLKDADKKVYVAQQSPSQGSAYKRKGIKASAKEIRMAFMNVQNAIAKLEDMIMPVIENSEEKHKALQKIKNML